MIVSPTRHWRRCFPHNEREGLHVSHQGFLLKGSLIGDITIFGENSLNSKFNSFVKILIVIPNDRLNQNIWVQPIFTASRQRNLITSAWRFQVWTHLYFDHLPAKTSVDSFLAFWRSWYLGCFQPSSFFSIVIMSLKMSLAVAIQYLSKEWSHIFSRTVCNVTQSFTVPVKECSQMRGIIPKFPVDNPAQAMWTFEFVDF